MREFKRSARVVIQAPHQALVSDVGVAMGRTVEVVLSAGQSTAAIAVAGREDVRKTLGALSGCVVRRSGSMPSLAHRMTMEYTAA